jgi:DNA-directed RNA polymerase I, II, and III subunit RPABC2
MSYFDGDSDDNKKYNDDSSDTSSDEEDVFDDEIDEDEILEDESIDENENDDEISSDKEIDNDIKLQEGGNEENKEKKRSKKIPSKQKEVVKSSFIKDIDDDDDDDDDGELYLQKFDKEMNENYLVNCHPECVSHNYDEVIAMTKVIRDENGIIIDDLHKTIPFLTKFEKARILGQRAKQINSGATPFIKVPENIIDGYLIAELELKQKRIPFIVRRPLPNGGSEYWSLKDLEDISF